MNGKAAILTIALSILFLSCLSGCSAIDRALSPSEIEDGFTERWLKTLSGEYHIDIPKSAIYLKGFYEPGQDFSVHMLFTVNAGDFDDMVGEDWTDDSDDPSFGGEWYMDLTDAKLPHCYVYSKKYTVLFRSDASEDGKVTCVFVGWRP